jgi:hypothetical protein
MNDESKAQLVDMQKHRDAWRGYAYGIKDKPSDFLDGNMVNRPMTFLEINAELLGKAEAEQNRLRELLGHAYRFEDMPLNKKEWLQILLSHVMGASTLQLSEAEEMLRAALADLARSTYV